jgi:hypothetical protein
MTAQTKTFTMLMPVEQHKAFKRLALDEDSTMADLIRDFITTRLKQEQTTH